MIFLTFYIQNPRTIDCTLNGIEDDFLRLCLCHPCRQLQVGVVARSAEIALKIQPRILQHKFTLGSLASPIRVIKAAQNAHLADRNSDMLSLIEFNCSNRKFELETSGIQRSTA